MTIKRKLWHLALNKYVSSMLRRGLVLKPECRGLQSFEHISDALEYCYEFTSFDRVLIGFSTAEKGLIDELCNFQRHGKALVLQKSIPTHDIHCVYVLNESGFSLKGDFWHHDNVPTATYQNENAI